jgi:hypothetical protein
MAVARWGKASTKMMVWLGVMAKPLVSALSLSALHPCFKVWLTLFFVERLIRSLEPSIWGMSAKTLGAVPTGGAASAAAAAACRTAICTWRLAMMTISSALVGGAPAMFAWHLIVATMITTSGSYWELFFGATNLEEGDTFG